MGAPKPEFTLPTMGDVTKAAGTNGYTSVSTFSGCGGSSTGYKLAGFNVAYAAEFDLDAVAAYHLNYPTTPMFAEDIKNLSGEHVLKELGMGVGDLDLLEGSPPCSKFSVNGGRQKMWNQTTWADSDSRVQADVEDLFFEFTRLVREIQPRMFCAENVPGLRMGVVKGYFKMIVDDLTAAGYRVAVYEVDAQWCGVPQVRRRLFFTGVRRDLPVERIDPPVPAPYRYTMCDALPHLGEDATLHMTFGWTTIKRPIACATRAAPTIARLGIGGGTAGEAQLSNAGIADTHDDPPGVPPVGSIYDKRTIRPRFISIPELKVLASFPVDFQLEGSWKNQWARIGNAVPPLMAQAVAGKVREALDACR